MEPIGPIVGMKSAARTIFYVDDLAETVRFYTDVIGLVLAYPADHGWAEFTMDAGSFCLHDGRAADAPARGLATVGWRVDDVDAAHALLRERGLEPSAVTVVTEGMRCVEFRDPSGNNLFFEGA